MDNVWWIVLLLLVHGEDSFSLFDLLLGLTQARLVA